MDFATAMERARNDLTLLQEKFIQPLNLQDGKSAKRIPPAASRPDKTDKGKVAKLESQLAATRSELAAVKSKNKNKGGGKGKKDKRKLLPPGVELAPKHQGKNICFSFGRQGCKKKNCSMLHICQICFGNHPFPECSKMTGKP